MQEYYPNLDYFIIIAEEKSLTHAAVRLAVSQQSLTSYLKRLENFYQTPLFKREYRKLSLTPFGEKTYESALKIRTLNRQLIGTGRQYKNTADKIFRISVYNQRTKDTEDDFSLLLA